jgi:2-polyprenyl-3-methyl-5-hydroxy-6-metoxy-1,4-benzoquinol methylase
LPDNHYVNAQLAELYDLDSGWSADRDFYLALASAQPQNILDLGCGTGLLCHAYAAKGHSVTGVDPSPAMLEVARRKPNGGTIEWVQGYSQNYRSDKRFDLIIMTGHAFQVLLEDDDIAQTLCTIKQHLSPDGLAVFESRNPAFNWQANWNYDITLESPTGTVHESRRFISMQNNRLFFELTYEFSDHSLKSASELRFCSRQEIEDQIIASGLHLVSVLGDWDGKPFEERASQEMIFKAKAS